MLDGKVIIVMGGAGLLGTTFIRVIAAQNGIVIAADINFDAAKLIVQEVVSSGGGEAWAEKVDITDRYSVCGLLERVKNKYGRIDAVVNNAYPRNRNYGRNVEEVTYSDFTDNLSMHLGGYFLVAQQACRFFVDQEEGNLVNMASIYGTLAPRFEVYKNTTMTMPIEYAAIKAGVIQLSRYFANYYKSKGIRVNCLSPGGIRNEQPSIFLEAYDNHCGFKGMLDATDTAGSLIYLLSDSSKYVTGQNIIVDDGFSL